MLLWLMCIITSLNALSSEFALVGAYSDWNFSKSTILEVKQEGIYEGTVSSLTSGFKIVDIENNNWDIQYGAQSPSELLSLGQPLSLKAKDGGPDPANIEFANMVSEVKNAKVIFNTTSNSLTITGEAVYDYPELWVCGSMFNWDAPGEGQSVAMAHNGSGVYTAIIDFGSASDSFKEFKFVGRGWSPDFCWPKDNESFFSEINNTATLVRNGNNIKTDLCGKYKVTFDINTLLLNAENRTAGIFVTEVSHGTPRYYNLQGDEVTNPENGIYIVKRGNKVTKEIRH